jgi:hypothetical protein
MRDLFPAVGVLLALAVPACSAPSEPALGITRTPAGSLQVRFAPCGQERIHDVWLGRSIAEPPVTDVVWAIHAPTGSERRDLVIGQAPAGFEIAVPLIGRLDDNVTYTAYVETGSGNRYHVDFDPQEPREDLFLTVDREWLTPERFVEQRQSGCGEQWVLGITLLVFAVATILVFARVMSSARRQRATPPRPDR